MSRHHSSSSSKTTRQLPPTLERLELKCNCKLTMRPHCLVGRLPGCRERRRMKRCSCRVDLLPVCLVGDGIGCEDRQLGKRCECRKAMLPRCFALGCEKRKEGHNCQCPRTPGEPCKHVLRLTRHPRFADMLELTKESARKRDRFLAWWVERLKYYDDYLEPDPPEPDVEITQEGRVILMEGRENMGVGLWHPQDVRSPGVGGREEELLARRRVDFFRLIRKQGGGSNGAA